MRNLGIAASAATTGQQTSSTTESIYASLKLTSVAVGSLWRYETFFRHDSPGTTSSTWTWQPRIGTAGTTADAAIGSGFTTGASTVSNGHAHMEGNLWIISSTAVGFAFNWTLYGTATPAGMIQGNASTATGLTTLTTSMFLSFGQKSSVAAGTWTVMQYVIEQIR